MEGVYPSGDVRSLVLSQGLRISLMSFHNEYLWLSATTDDWLKSVQRCLWEMSFSIYSCDYFFLTDAQLLLMSFQVESSR